MLKKSVLRIFSSIRLFVHYRNSGGKSQITEKESQVQISPRWHHVCGYKFMVIALDIQWKCYLNWKGSEERKCFSMRPRSAGTQLGCYLSSQGLPTAEHQIW